MGLFVLLAVVYTVLTNVYSLYLGGFSELLSPAETVLVYVIAAGAALVLTLLAYQFKQAGQVNPASSVAGLAGMTMSLFATACPVCPPLWVALLGLTGSLFFLADLRLPIELASLALLTVSWHVTAQRISTANTCEVRLR